MILTASPLILMILFRKLTKPDLPQSNRQTKSEYQKIYIQPSFGADKKADNN
ncbi:hypothetical protein YC2023_042651 [Brassica napus]